MARSAGMTVNKRIELLRTMPIFGGLKTESLELLLRESKEVIAKEGDFFFREGDAGGSVFVLEAGTVLVQRIWQDETIELGRLAKGDCFGEMSLIDFQPRSAGVKAESNCQALEISQKALRSLYSKDIEEYALIMMNLGREVSRRLRVADDCLFQLQKKPSQIVD